MQWGSSTEPDLTEHEEFFKSRLSQMYAILAKQEDWTLTSMTLLECMIQVPEENLLQWQDGTKITRPKMLKLRGTLKENNTDVIHMTKRICECIWGRYKELSQPTPLPKTGPQTGHDTKGASNADSVTPQDSHSRDNSEDVLMVTGLSSNESSTSSLFFFL